MIWRADLNGESRSEENTAGQEVSFAANLATVPAYWAPALDPDAPGVLVLHAWWGLNAFFKRFCDRLAQAGFSALVPSLFEGKTAATIPEAGALVQEFEQGKLNQVQATSLAANDQRPSSTLWARLMIKTQGSALYFFPIVGKG